jgi:polyferredoxin
MDAPLVLLSAYVLLTLVLWGRGVFCGWLCPFGALQELSNRIARLLRVPQVALREHWQARLWLVKYGVLAAVLGAALVSRETANTVAEVEPFKTAISLQFQRAWPYVAYAGALLAVGLIYERAFCRFLCPLGALLALAGRWHIFDWLKRRPECGSPCQICNTSCPVGAIPLSGKINMSECLQYLDCQVEYYDDRRCPPLATERKQKEAMAAE